MTNTEILDAFTRILRDLLGNDSICLTNNTERQDVEGWDSFAYINFIAAVEAELGLRFRVADVESFRNVGEIVASVQAHSDL